MKEIDWSKVPECAIGAFTRGDETFFVKTKQPSEYMNEPGFQGVKCDGKEYHVFTEYWAWSERPATWTGEGLPPVGTVCEVLNNTLDRPEWERCTILFMGKFKAVYESESCHERVADVSESWMISFRPLRTPEQIAAEERLHNVRNACTAIADTLDSLRGKTKVERAALAVVEAMIDAGYAKVTS